MTPRNVMLRCDHCGAINRVPAERLREHPKCGKCKSHLNYSKRPIDVSTTDFAREVLSWPGDVLVEFWASWCGHCRGIAPVVDEIAHDRAGILKVVKINIDNEQNLAASYDIRATPTFMIFRNGKRISDIAGALPKAQLEAWIDSSLV
ncbi:MAG: thioredoxin TrxC [Nitrospirota bacterium]